MSTNIEEGWIKPTDKIDAVEISIKSYKKEAKKEPEQIIKKIGAIFYKEGDTFQIGKNGKAIINRVVPVGHKFTVQVQVIIEKSVI